MKVDNVSFQAHLPSQLKDRLLMEAINHKPQKTNAFVNKLKEVRSWGYDTSTITTVQKKDKDVKTEMLALVNSYYAPFKKAILPVKDSLLSSFLSLTKKDIKDAEKVLQI